MSFRYHVTEIVPGDDWYDAIVLKDPETGQVIDYSQWTVTACKFGWDGLSPEKDVTVDNSEAAQGKFRFHLPKAETGDVPMGNVSHTYLVLTSPAPDFAETTVYYARVIGVETRTRPEEVTVYQAGVPGASVTDVLNELGITKITISYDNPSGGQDLELWLKIPQTHP